PIREASAGELPALSELEERSARLFEEDGYSLPPDPTSLDRLRAAQVVLVAGDPPLGFASLGLVDGEAHLEQISVDPSAGRRGIGTRLLVAVLEHARAAGHDAITLTTYRDVPWNGPWYVARGFRELAPPDCGPELCAIREEERAAGLDAVGPRVAMRRPLE
ncbi:MAG: GNAT family N-acetyltransferase, partial [Candidatus Dormiibacterota bacterium]